MTQFVLHSGSLKDLAATFGVSYPTIRARVDRVIERLRAEIAGRPADPVNTLLGELLESGEITSSAARKLKQAVQVALSSGPRDAMKKGD